MGGWHEGMRMRMGPLGGWHEGMRMSICASPPHPAHRLVTSLGHAPARPNRLDIRFVRTSQPKPRRFHFETGMLRLFLRVAMAARWAVMKVASYRPMDDDGKYRVRGSAWLCTWATATAAETQKPSVRGDLRVLMHL